MTDERHHLNLLAPRESKPNLDRLYRDVVLPQAIPPMVPAIGNYLIDMFKATPILSVVSVLEMMARAPRPAMVVLDM